MIFNLK